MYPSRVVELRPRAGVREAPPQPNSDQLVLIGWRRWLGKGALAIADKGLVNGSNFVISVALARWLPPQDYGAFALAFASFLLLASAHTALFTDPMLLFGAGTYRERLPEYLGVLLRGHWAFTAAASLILFAAAIGVMLGGHSVLANALVALAFASPLILLHWLLRQACYVRLDARQAACAGASYMMCVLLGTYLLHDRGWLSPATGITLMGLASLVSAVGMFISLGMGRPHSREPQLFHDIVADHWRYGRWSLGTYILSWIKEGIYYLLLPAAGGLGAAAALKALLNLTQPITHTYGALSCVLVPAMVGAREGAAVQRIARSALGLLSVGALLYWAILGLFGRSVIHWLYDGRYEAYAGLLWVVAAIPLVYAGEIVLGSVLRSRERPHHVFWANMLSAITTLTVGATCVVSFGLHGAVVGLFCSSIATVGTMAFVLRRRSSDGRLTRVPGGNDH